jgi:integrase
LAPSPTGPRLVRSPIGYANKRAEMWGNMREWLRSGAIDNDPELIADLTGVEYGYVLRDGRDVIQLERKEDMKRRGLASSDNGDALALTFSYPVLASSASRSRRPDRFYRANYNPYALRPDEMILGAEGPLSSDRAAAEWLRGRALGRPFADDDDVRDDLDEISTLGRAMRYAQAEAENRTGLAAIRALLLTGCRRNEMLALPWEWVDLKARCIRFGDTKSGSQIRPIGAAAVEYLSALPSRDRCRWVFPADKGYGHFIGVPRVLARLCTRCGFENVSIHTLRHSFGGAAAELGFSELTIAGLLGHSVPGVTARYAHVPDSALVAAADRVAAHIAAALDGEAGAGVVELRRQSA